MVTLTSITNHISHHHILSLLPQTSIPQSQMATATTNLHHVFPFVHPITTLTPRFLRRVTLTTPNGFFSSSSSSSLLTPRAIDANDFLGDFGARDPFPAELESSFGDKVLGYGNTEHKILIPNISALSLSQQDCSPISPLQPPITQHDAHQLIRKVVGWRLLNEEGVLKLQCLWKLRDFKCGVELINRISKVAEAAGHFPSIHLEQPNQIRAELWTSSIGGLSMNDFIVAAKIDEIKTSDLVPKKRVWA